MAPAATICRNSIISFNSNAANKGAESADTSGTAQIEKQHATNSESAATKIATAAASTRTVATAETARATTARAVGTAARGNQQ